jgi:alpha-L-rhamnosidase
MINQGATTIWERWDGYVKGRGFQNPSMNSFNHYAFGAIGEFFYRVILGINLDKDEPSFKHIIIKPKPNKNLTWARGYYNSVRGKIEVEWHLNENEFKLNITIPPNTHATVYFLALDIDNVSESNRPLKEFKHISIGGIEKNLIILEVDSGTYQFNSKIANK